MGCPRAGSMETTFPAELFDDIQHIKSSKATVCMQKMVLYYTLFKMITKKTIFTIVTIIIEKDTLLRKPKIHL